VQSLGVDRGFFPRKPTLCSSRGLAELVTKTGTEP